MLRRMRLSRTTGRFCFLLLLAFVATASFQGNGEKGMFALAAEPEHNTMIESRGLLRRTKSALVTERVTEGEGCEEDTEGFQRKKKNGKKIQVCKWVKKRKKKLCNKTIKIKNADKRKQELNLREYCACTCSDVPSKPPKTEETKASCPTGMISPETQLKGTSCSKGQRCGYRHVVTGCKASELMCLPVVNCFCQPDLTFMCAISVLPGISDCPGPTTRPPPPDYEEPPSNVGKYCDPEDPSYAISELIGL